MEKLVVKLQRDMTGTKILITEVPGGRILRESVEREATQLADSYDLDPMGRTFADAEVDANGLLFLGNEIDDPEDA